MGLVKNFKEISKENVAIAGGKGASLGELMNAGIPVPNGFVILSNAFEQFIEETKIMADIDAVLHKVNYKDINYVEVASEQIQGIILSQKMPKDIENEIKKYFKKMWGILPNMGRSDSGTHYLWFNTENTIKFFAIIKDHILPLFSYKIDLERKLMWRALSRDELRYIKENYNIEHPRLIAHKLGRPLQSIFGAAHRLGVTQPRGGVKRYERYT